MKLNDSNIIDVKCNGRNVEEIKKTTYRSMEIYAVKRSTNLSDAECALLGRGNKAWWCGCVEVPPGSIYSLLKPRGYLDIPIMEKWIYSYSCDLAVVHGGYTYLNYGIPLVLDDNQKLFLGWDYNHFCDTESCVTYDEIINEGKKVIDSMFKKIKEKDNE